MKRLWSPQMRKTNDMISIIDLDAEGLRGMGAAITMANCGLMVTRDRGPAEDEAAGTPSVSLGIMIRPHKQI
jgi:hypothetical protein